MMKVNCTVSVGSRIMAQVAVPVDASDTEVILKALKEHDQCPTVNANWPEMGIGEIRNGIANGVVKRYEVFPSTLVDNKL